MDDQEKQSFRVSSQSRKYGAIANRSTKIERLIRHEIQKDDTLQGISLKYGCTTEQIRRANRLFASDSLFLRQYLLIPVDKDSPYYPAQDERPHSLPPQRAASIAGYPSSSDGGQRRNSMDQVSPQISPEEENRKHLEDFLNKIDSSISNSKKFVKQHKEVVPSSQSDNEIFAQGSADYLNPTTSYQQYHHNNSGGHSSTTHHNSYGPSNNNNYTNNNGAEAYQMSVISKGKHVKTSLQRLEQTQDEFFEL